MKGFTRSGDISMNPHRYQQTDKKSYSYCGFIDDGHRFIMCAMIADYTWNHDLYNIIVCIDCFYESHYGK